jgi:16S rRNA (uracil1498-N3)-methyltransferase
LTDYDDMADRFFHPELRSRETVALDGPEAHHLTRVRRIAPGEWVTLFDGRGGECQAQVVSADRRRVTLRLQPSTALSRELPLPLELAVAPPPGDRFRWLVEKATELGVSRLIPLLTARAGEHVRHIDAARCERWVIEASKQCGRNHLMSIAAPMTWTDLLADPAPHWQRIVLHPGSRPFEPSSIPAPAGFRIAVGPEGGFSDAELGAARAAGWSPTGLGPTVLRVETAALAMCALVRASMAQFPAPAT